MMTARLIVLTHMVAAALAVSAAAQGAKAPAIKIVFINTNAFQAKDGITKYTKAIDLAIGEPGPAYAEMKAIRAKMEALAKESNEIGDRLDSSPPYYETDGLTRRLLAKIDELVALDIEFNHKEQDAKAEFERRKNEVLTPIMKDIDRAIQEFAKQRGYSVILDAAKLDTAIVCYDTEKADVTLDFIAFYNARPAPAPKP